MYKSETSDFRLLLGEMHKIPLASEYIVIFSCLDTDDLLDEAMLKKTKIDS